MTFKIKLYTFSKKANSTAQPTGGTDYDCLIKTPSGITNPVVQLKHSNPIAYNYAYIADFSRYYFISDVKYDSGLWTLYLKIDVLATYKTAIGSTSTYVLRAANGQDQYLIDNAFPVTGKVTYDSTIFESNIGLSYTSGYFIVTCSGDMTGAGVTGKTTYQLNPSDFNTMVNNLFTTANGYNFGDLTQGVINSIMNPLDYICSVIWSPTSFTTSGTAPVMCGLWYAGVSGAIVTNMLPVAYTVSIPKHPQAATYGKYCNMEPYTFYDLDMGLGPTIHLDTSMLVDVSQILVTIERDPITGIGIMEGRTVTATNQMQLFKITVPYGVSIPMTQLTTSVAPVIQNAVQSAARFAADDVVGGAVYASKAIGSAISAFVGDVSNTGSQGSITGHMMNKRLFSRFYEIAPRDTVNMGKPYCKMATPSSLGGYMQCSNAHVSISGTDTEAGMINSYMESGFYYE